MSSNRWYQGITTYQWLVLLIASLGWVFDVFEGQVFVASMDELAKELLGSDATEGDRSFYNNISMGMFLFGGAMGGVAFGVVSDRIGRARTMILTILMYSAFTCLTAFAQEWWHVAVLRFLVAMGVGGEWAVASSMVAEHFPTRARAWSGAIFHASSVFGTFLAVAVGEFIVANPQWGWRWAFGIGVVPALLTLWIRWQLRDRARGSGTGGRAFRHSIVPRHSASFLSANTCGTWCSVCPWRPSGWQLFGECIFTARTRCETRSCVHSKPQASTSNPRRPCGPSSEHR